MGGGEVRSLALVLVHMGRGWGNGNVGVGDLLLRGEKLLRGGGRIVHDVGVGVVKLLLGRGGVGVEEALLELGRHLPI